MKKGTDILGYLSPSGCIVPTMQHTTPLQQFGALASLIFATVIWGSTFILVKWSVAELDVYYFIFLRFSIAAVAMGLIFRGKIKTRSSTTLRSSFILSIALFAGYALQTEALRFTSASNTALITGLYLVMVPLFLIAFFKDKPSISHVIGAVVSLVGLYFLTQYSPAGFNLGDGLALLCAVAFAFQIILMGRYTRTNNLAPFVFYQFVFVAMYAGVIALTRMSFSFEFSTIAIITLIVTGVFATALAFAIQAAAQRYIDPTRVGIILGLEAVFGLLFGVFVGNEALTMLSFFGACLMVCGMMIAEAKPVVKYLVAKMTG